jgi:glycosyltransferase involved in cell wall biosynthesis
MLFKRILTNSNLQCLVIVSKALETSLQESFSSLLEGQNIVVAHDAVDLDEFDLRLTQVEARKKVNLPEDAFIAGYTGSFFRGKGIEIISELASNLKEFVFVAVGSKPKDLLSFKDKTQSFGLGNLIIRNFSPHKLIPVYLKAFDILLMPHQKLTSAHQRKLDTILSLSPLKMFEYMASGRPIVASRLNTTEEILVHQKNALLVTPSDIDAWGQCIRTLKKNKALAEKMAEQARKDVKTYSWDERVKKIFSGVISSNKGPR